MFRHGVGSVLNLVVDALGCGNVFLHRVRVQAYGHGQFHFSGNFTHGCVDVFFRRGFCVTGIFIEQRGKFGRGRYVEGVQRVAHHGGTVHLHAEGIESHTVEIEFEIVPACPLAATHVHTDKHFAFVGNGELQYVVILVGVGFTVLRHAFHPVWPTIALVRYGFVFYPAIEGYEWDFGISCYQERIDYFSTGLIILSAISPCGAMETANGQFVVAGAEAEHFLSGNILFPEIFRILEVLIYNRIQIPVLPPL